MLFGFVLFSYTFRFSPGTLFFCELSVVSLFVCECMCESVRVLSVFVSGKRFIVISLFIIVFETKMLLSSAFQLGSMRHAPFTRLGGTKQA